MDSKSKKVIAVIRRCTNLRFILKRKNKELFEAIKIYQNEVNDHFRGLGAELIINDDLGVIQIKEMAELLLEDLPQFGRALHLTPIESLVLIFLRKKRMDYFSSGNVETDQVLVEKEEIKSFLEGMKVESDPSKIGSRTERTIKELQNLQVLLGTKKTNNYEISSVCDVILDPQSIDALNSNANQYFDALTKRNQE